MSDRKLFRNLIARHSKSSPNCSSRLSTTVVFVNVVSVLLFHAAVAFGSDGIDRADTAVTGQSNEPSGNATATDAVDSASSAGSDSVVSPYDFEWSHSVYLDDEKRARLYWTPRDDEIVMRVEAPTRGSVGVGFARHVHSSGSGHAGSDLAVGWVRNGKAFLQDRHGLPNGDTKLDKRQDWQLIGGYENATHTSIVISRRYDTCDRNDVKITNDTMRLIYAFHKDDPGGTGGGGGSDPGGRTKSHGRPQRGAKSLLLVQRPLTSKLHNRPGVVHWDLRNPKILLPRDEDTLYWCKIFKLPNITKKHHLIGYDPIDEGNAGYMHHSLVYECRSDGPADAARFEDLFGADGHDCYQVKLPALLANCDKIVAAWTTGSAGFAMPSDVGYSMDPDVTKYYKLEIHFDNHLLKKGIRVSSGLRLYLDPTLRQHEAGVLSVGIDSNWRHIIPPQQKATTSYGHCISECTEQAFSRSNAITVFAVSLQTHSLGRKWRLRHVTNGTEVTPLAADSNYDSNYQEFRMLPDPTRIYPGDHLIAECTYNSRGRDGITVGGRSTREEMCLAFIYYYPRISMPACLSSPTFASAYESMGVEEMWSGTFPPSIRKPEAYANHTLAEHLSNYDWDKHIGHFEEVIKFGSFEATCMVNGKRLPPTHAVSSFGRNVTELSGKHSNDTRACLRHHHHQHSGQSNTPPVPTTTSHRPPRRDGERRPKSSVNRTTQSGAKFDNRRTDSRPATSQAGQRHDDVTTFHLVMLLVMLVVSHGRPWCLMAGF